MTPSSPSSPPPPLARGRLIFQWPERNASFVLPLLFVLAVGVHALTFYGFQVVYPPVASTMPPAASVTLITPSSPANAALLEWIDSQDPAKAPRLQETLPAGLGEIAYLPSYATVQTLPKPAEPAAESTFYPPAYDPLTLLAPVTAARETPRGAAPSLLTFSEALQQRDAGKREPMAVATRAEGSLLPSVFLIGIGDRGEILYTFLQASSGSRALDEEAERILLRHEFSRQEGAPEVVWGFATFTWGADAFAAPIPSTSSSTAP